jgi:hypothetical protein
MYEYLVAYEKNSYIFSDFLRLFDPLGVLNIRKFRHFRNKVDHDESFELSFNIGFVRTTENVPLLALFLRILAADSLR